MSSASDDIARSTALDPARSFIVQAPAGSGKTELLIQRYLALLATVQHPEQIVAITFTRKAAAEMRTRVLRALRGAADNRTPTKAHERGTFALARAVVERDAALDWQLLAQPQRLRVDTLDAFNVWLAQQLPVLSGGVAAAAIVDKPDDLHARAARLTVGALIGDAAATDHIRTLLRVCDNDAEQLARLLAALLPRREQWLPRFVAHSEATLRAELEAALQRLVDDELSGVAALCPSGLFAELAPLLAHAAAAADDAMRTRLAPWLAIDRPPPSGPLALAAWRGVAALLLTKGGEWRSRVTKNEGFGPQHAAPRDRMRSMLDALRDDDALRAALRTVATLPEPHYSAAQWQTLIALKAVLVRLAAELKVQFADARSVDFVELALAAQRALGEVDSPSDLLLALDGRIQHLLVDEFQDTSHSQFRLLELLTAGWQDDDGRTLFLVGDPMQSIYRFRDADMSLFLRAKQRGIGAVRLTSLTLTRNFRSAPPVVEWVNAAFAGVFPAEDQLAAGVAAFRPSLAVRTADDARAEPFVATHGIASDEPFAEAERVVELVAAERRRAPEQSIAVLVQSRTHLAGLRERLRKEGWPVHAIEIDTLAEQQVAQDLAGLTRALLHRSDRVAWLAVLRAPWCGMTWTDLALLCGDAPRRAVLDLLHEDVRVATLSADGRRRAAAVRGTLDAALARRDGRTLARFVEDTWLALGGPLCLDDEAERLAAEQFLALLASLESRGDLDDPLRLHAALGAVQPQADAPHEKGVEIMTMHRAKGLEFDTVILLGLGREPRPDDPRALQWLGRVAADGSDDLVMVPAALAGDADGERLVDFVRRAERDRDRAERARLLYVATTRARERLHLVWQLGAEQQSPASSSMLACLWPLVGGTPSEEARPAPTTRREELVIVPRLRRLVAPLERSGDALGAAVPTAARPEFAWAGQAAVHVGTVVHRHLQRIAEANLVDWTAARIRAAMPRFRQELELLGVEREELGRAAERVSTALTHAIGDDRGRWILGPHTEARSELRMTLRVGDALEHLRIDRTFVADGTRWIVDFKTSEHEGGDIASFLDSEVERYAPQLERYARALAAIDERPVRLGLYFPLLREFRAWAATASP